MRQRRRQYTPTRSSSLGGCALLAQATNTAPRSAVLSVQSTDGRDDERLGVEATSDLGLTVPPRTPATSVSCESPFSRHLSSRLTTNRTTVSMQEEPGKSDALPLVGQCC